MITDVVADNCDMAMDAHILCRSVRRKWLGPNPRTHGAYVVDGGFGSEIDFDQYARITLTYAEVG